MTRSFGLAACSALLALALPAAAERTVTVEQRGDGAAGCSGVHQHFGDRTTARGEETVTLPRAGTKGLVFEGARNGGVTIRGGDVSSFTITACTAAAGDDEAAARAALSKVALKTSGGRVTIEGPDGERWTAFLVVTAPRDADFSVETTNGPLSLTGLSGTLSVRAANGPISLSALTGTVDVEAANGPVTVKGASGDMKIRAINGPLTIALQGDRWEGKGLDASSKNGPVTVKLPDGWTSGVRLEASSHSPLSCRAAACDGARREDGDRTRLLEFGSGSPSVRVSTVNGPVSVTGAAGRS